MITVAGEFPAAGVAVSGRHFGLAIPLYVGNGGGFGLRSGAVGSYGFKESIVFPMPVYVIKNLRPSKLDRERGKGYVFDLFDHHPNHHINGGWFNWGQVEVAVGVGAGVRAGVNFCEIADFVVGLVGVDICDDDIAGEKQTNPLRLRVTYRSDPPGGTLYKLDGELWGECPKVCYYNINKGDIKRGYFNVRGLMIRWPSGPAKKTGDLIRITVNGTVREVTFVQPEETSEYSVVEGDDDIAGRQESPSED
jgi:hypothetical protein